MSQEQIDPMKVKKNPSIPTVLFVLRDDAGCGFYRCLQPALSLRKRQLMNTITDVYTTTPEHIEEADIVVLQSPGTPQFVQAFNYAKERGKPVLIEIDDFLQSVSLNNPGRQAWNPSTLYISRFEALCSKADGMIVSTEQLAREYFLLNSNIFVLENYLDEQRWTLAPTKMNDGLIRIGWAGGNAHVDDLRMVSPVIQRIVKEYDGKVKFETMGLSKKELQDTFPLQAFLDKCPKCDYQGEVYNGAGAPLQEYPMVLASHGWDIGLAPVIDTAFNNAKSDLKLKEYAAIGLPSVASSVTPYEQAERRGCKVFLARTHDEWYNAIKELIEHPELRQEVAAANKEWVSRYWIDDNIKKYYDVLSRFIPIKK